MSTKKDTSPNRLIHVIEIHPHAFRVYSSSLTSLGTFKNSEEAISKALEVQKLKKEIIAVHVSNGDVKEFRRPKERSLSLEDNEPKKKGERPAVSRALKFKNV